MLIRCSVFMMLLQQLMLDSIYAVDIDEAKIKDKLKVKLDFCKGKYDDENCALRWADKRSQIASYFANAISKLAFAHQNNMSSYYTDKIAELSVPTSAKLMQFIKEARKFKYTKFKNATTARRLKLISISSGSKDPKIRKKIVKIKNKMGQIYSSAKACYGPNNCLDAGEKPVNDMFKTETDYNKLLALWDTWQNASGYAVKPLYSQLVNLSNIGAKENGYRDAAYANWFTDFESKTFNSDVLTLYKGILHLYEHIHAYVRHKLAQAYPGKFDKNGCIPAHILGDLWAQQWTLPQSMLPYPNAKKVESENLLRSKFHTFHKLVREAESFYASLGLPNMTKTFWKKSNFNKPKDPEVIKDCHATAYTFQDGEDYRISMCASVNFEDMYVIHHEMGHVQYYMAYKHQPNEFQSGANSGFHEAIGDTIALSVSSFPHTQKLNITKRKKLPEEANINMLFATSLKKVAFLPFALSVDVFRWNVYNGTIPMADLNEGWWKIRSGFGGICPPNTRPRDGFDAGSKYHVANDISYIRYFVSFLLQFQFYDTMCTASGFKGDLNQCDFHNSKEAGAKFRKMMEAGSSKPWKELLKEFTGNSNISTKPILKYFKPLQEWLKDYNRRNKIHVGWSRRMNVLKGVSI